MCKTLITACMTLVTFAAFVVPATASAANTPLLTDAKGTVAAGSLIAGTNLGNTIFWNTAKTIEQWSCSKAMLTGKVLRNTTGEVELEITRADVSGTGGVNSDNNLSECTGTFGSFFFTVRNLPLTIKSHAAMANDEFQITAAAGANVKFLIGSTTAGECEYESTSSIKGDYTTGTSEVNDSLFTVRNTQAGSGSKLIRGGFLCPSSGMLQMTFALETDGTTEPIWVSP